MERIATTVEDKKLSTIVSGICISACGHIFLAGETRQFSDDFSLGMSFLGFHGMYRSSGSLEGYKGTVPTNSERWYVKRSGGKLEKTALYYGIITTAESRGYAIPGPRANAEMIKQGITQALCEVPL